MNPIETAWRQAFEPLERISLPDFAKKYVKVGAKKADFDLDFFRWLIEPMELMPDFRVPMQAQIMAAQLGKGRSAEAGVPFFVVHEPADITWYGMTNEKATEYSEERLMPTLLNCEPVQKYRPVNNRHKERTSAIVMDHMRVEVLGANETNTQSRTRQIIFCDECHLWESGMLASAISRTSAPNFVGRRKVIITSTAGDEDCDLERYWDTCDQRCWHVRCPNPECNEAHPLALSRDYCRRVPKHVPVFFLKWDENDQTRPGGSTWDMEAVKKTVRYVCPSCAHEFRETPEIMRKLRESGHYVPMNPMASKEKVGFWVPRMAAGEWAALVEKFLKCVQEMRMGDDSNLREFMLKDLAEKWIIGGSEVAEVRASSDYYLAEPPEAFQWDKEFARFMSVDRQALAPSFWYLVQAFSLNGESRWVECGHCNTKEEIEAIAAKHGLIGKKSVQVGVDAGWEADDTWEWAARNRWYAFRGDDVVSYRHPRPGKKAVLKYFSQRMIRRVGVGGKERLNVSCIEFMWSNISIKNFLSRLKSGNGLYYGIAKDIPKEFVDHLDSEYKKGEVKGSKTIYRWIRKGKRPNHLWDMACLNLVAAFMAGLIPIEMAEVEEEEKLEIEMVT